MGVAHAYDMTHHYVCVSACVRACWLAGWLACVHTRASARTTLLATLACLPTCRSASLRELALLLFVSCHHHHNTPTHPQKKNRIVGIYTHQRQVRRPVLPSTCRRRDGIKA